MKIYQQQCRDLISISKAWNLFKNYFSTEELKLPSFTSLKNLHDGLWEFSTKYQFNFFWDHPDLRNEEWFQLSPNLKWGIDRNIFYMSISKRKSHFYFQATLSKENQAYISRYELRVCIDDTEMDFQETEEMREFLLIENVLTGESHV